MPNSNTIHKQPPIWARHWSFALLYTIYTLFTLPIKISYYILRYSILPRGFRPLPTWTFQQAFVRALMRLVFGFLATVELNPFRSSVNNPGSEKSRFVIIPPFDKSDYLGAAKPTEDVAEQEIAGVWSPDRLKAGDNKRGERVFLHFHGGGYTLFDCRDVYTSFGVRLYLEASSSSPTARKARVFCARYRLSSQRDLRRNKFPAALQDAVTAYMYLVKRLGVDSRDVVLSGDSAGGNLALALLRYLQDHADEGKLPLPGGVLLWSPWVDLTVPPLEIAGHRNARYDVVLPQSALWGYRVFIPEDRGAEDAYISPVKKAIPTRVPIWLNWGGREVFADQIKEFVETQRKHAGSRVGTYEVADAPHDLFGVGEPLGWVKETKEAFGHAVRFLNES